MRSSSSNKCVLFPCLFFACLLFTISEKLVAGESDKVKLNLYYESLCPGCRVFIVNYLVKIFDSDLHTVTDLKLVPFGNAKVSDNLTVTCQHGEEECKLNAVEACAIRTWPDSHYSFMRCVENDTTKWESCLKNSRSEKAINDHYKKKARIGTLGFVGASSEDLIFEDLPRNVIPRSLTVGNVTKSACSRKLPRKRRSR
ncbi:hypothetical protein F2Q68_00020410 [Brassica cretica]|uniref:Gamma-interferon-inducible lysosomal thiol reductase n=1 Tax=Brassica cretica TaxID=69181 RepID=A0A8S9FUQ7_BRACR|nr:hypothetical protein F2Q68_00020410 [Brassica cretica]